MIYKSFQGKEISALGLGSMRLPVIDGDDARIDEAAAAEMVAYAMEHGINYYDTAWGYHSGNSELVLGKILSKYPRDKFYLASKFPGYDLSNMDKVEEIFEKQLEKCGVDYFDFYMFHNVCEMNIDAYLDKKYGIFDYLIKQKENGRIKHLGFSVHARNDNMKRFLEVYGKHMEFCQIQLNWLDWSFQEANVKVKMLREYNIPIWVMEPLRGGRLAKLPDSATAKLNALRPDEAIPAWSFRFLQAFDDVIVTLSGMSNLSQLKDNIRTYEEYKPLNGEETDTLFEIAKSMTGGVPCTSCRYCTSYCPQGLDIPVLLKLYNEHSFTGGGFLVSMALEAMAEDKQPNACIGCQSCEAVCPQQIKIADVLADFAAKLNG